MTKPVTIVTTGGTIGSILGDESIAVDPSESALREEIMGVADGLGVAFEIVSAINKNSEDLEPSDWAIVARHVADAIAAGSDRIVVLHGTDTMAFTAAILGGLFNRAGARICVTGSFLSPTVPGSDAALSIAAAIACVAGDDLPPGVYAAFRADGSNQAARIMPALAIKPIEFDGLSFGSAYTTLSATYVGGAGLSVAHKDAMFDAAPFVDLDVPDEDALMAAASRVGMLMLHPGLDRMQVSGSAADKDLLVLVPYHSGTGPSTPASGLVQYLSTRGEGAADLLLSQFPGVYIPKPYASTVTLSKLGCRVYRHLQAHVLFAWGVLALAAGLDRAAFLARIEPWLMLGED